MNRLTNRARVRPRTIAVARAARLATVLLVLSWAGDLRAQPPDSSGASPAASPAGPFTPAPETQPLPAPPPPSEGSPGPPVTIEALLRRDFSDRALLPFVPDTVSSMTEASAWQSLAPRLQRAGYHNVTVYPLESTGFAVVCPIEHIKDNGSRKQPEWGWTRSDKGVWNWFKSMVAPRTERYRMLMLIVPSAPAAANPAPPDTAYAELLLAGNQPQPRSSHASRAIADRLCELRVYEFYRKNENAPPEFLKTSATGARGHAERSQLWTKEELR